MTVREDWSGRWVAEALDIEVAEGGGIVPLHDLVGMALRINPRRPHLLVSRVLAKHVPTDPLLVCAAGELLGLHVAHHRGLLRGVGAELGYLDEKLRGVLAALGDPNAEPDEAGVKDAIASLSRDLGALSDRVATVTDQGLVFGYAETATALGHLVARALKVPSLHSTRREIAGTRSVIEFDEAHSHATRHLVVPADPDLLDVAGPLVLVDDELTTGRTALATIRAFHAHRPRETYVIATLLDARVAADRAEIERVAAELGVTIDVVALGVATVAIPDGATAPEVEQGAGSEASTPAPSIPAPSIPAPSIPAHHSDPGDAWPVGVREGGRHGFGPSDEAYLDAASVMVATQIRAVLAPEGDTLDGEILVLGTEELMYAPLTIAATLRRAGIATSFSTTTRSPVQVRDVDGYAVRSAVRFLAHDRDAEGYGDAPRFAYNVAARPWSAIVVVLDRPGATAALEAPDGLLAALTPYAPVVLPVVLPVVTPGPGPLRGPGFGSYGAGEVGWLLQDLSHVALEGDRETRERAIQSGAAHYAESLPTEYRPDEAYRALYVEQLAEVSDRVAAAVVTVAELSRHVRGRDDLVLVSLARAGTPIGILMRRWAARNGWNWPHFALSIVRDRGIDEVAMRWLADRYDPARVLVVDGWTGKGAIAREFASAIASTNTKLRLSDGGFAPEIAVLADPGECVDLFGTRDDFLIPSACLNSTVSGLVSRTVLNADLIGEHEFHGAKFYAELAGDDVSGEFLDAVCARFADVEATAVLEGARLAACDRSPTWSGWAAAEKLQADLGLPSVNLVKPGVGETTRVLLRRVPWQVAVRPGREADLRHVRLLAADRGVPVVETPDLPYSCVGIIRPSEQDGVVTTLFASDLDRTLIYSAAAMRLGRAVTDPVCVEIYDDAPTSFIDPLALSALAGLSSRSEFVPVTTRTREQYARITLPGVRVATAVTTNGAVILENDAPCGDWAAQVRTASEAGAPYAESWERIGRVLQRSWVRKVRDAEEWFFYAVISPEATPDSWFAELAEQVAGLGWVLSVQGRKCYVIPPGLTKQAAVAEVARRHGAGAVATAGDSWLDAGMLASADFAVRPAHGELHERDWTSPGLRVTSSAGGRAAAEIVELVEHWSEAV